MKKQLLLKPLLALALVMLCGNAWGESVTLFSESFGNNSGSARIWDDAYKEQGGITDVYNEVNYSITNAKQSKNTIGSIKSCLTQTTTGTDAVFEFGPLKVADYSNLVLTYKWQAGSIKGTYYTKVYYKEANSGSYTEVSASGNGATSFVDVTAELPEEAICNDLYIKIVFNTSNTNALIDEVVLVGEVGYTSKTLSSITISNQKTEFYVGDEFEFGGVVMASYVEEDVPDANVTSKASFSGYNMNIPDIYTVTVSYEEKSVIKTAQYFLTVSEKPKYVVTIESPENGTLKVMNGAKEVVNGDEVIQGTELSITPTPNIGYKFRNWQAKDNTTHTYTTSFSYVVNSAVTIKANFDQLAVYTVTYKGYNSSEQVYEGDAIINAPTLDAPTGFTFAGWSEDEYREESTSEPVFAVNNEYKPTKDVTLFPMYCRVVPAPTVTAISSTLSGTSEQKVETGKAITYKMSAKNDYSDPLRVYSGNTLTIAGADHIIRIELKGSDSKYPINNLQLETSNGTFDNGIWQGDASTIKFKASAQARVDQISVTYKNGNDAIYYSSYLFTISAAKYATLCMPFNFTVPESVTAYTAKVDYEKNFVNITAIDENAVIPAGMGIIISGNQGSYTFTGTTETATITDSNNDLVGVTQDTELTGGYILALDENDNNKVKFFQINSSDNILGAYKAYLDYTGSANALGIRVNDATGIRTIEAQAVNQYFDLMGRKVQNPERGIYILNGKKVYVK